MLFNDDERAAFQDDWLQWSLTNASEESSVLLGRSWKHLVHIKPNCTILWESNIAWNFGHSALRWQRFSVRLIARLMFFNSPFCGTLRRTENVNIDCLRLSGVSMQLEALAWRLLSRRGIVKNVLSGRQQQNADLSRLSLICEWKWFRDEDVSTFAAHLCQSDACGLELVTVFGQASDPADEAMIRLWSASGLSWGSRRREMDVQL